VLPFAFSLTPLPPLPGEERGKSHDSCSISYELHASIMVPLPLYLWERGLRGEGACVGSSY